MDQEVEFEGYLTDVFSKKTGTFIRSNRDGPFFVTVSYNAPHSPIVFDHPEKYMQRIASGIGPSGPMAGRRPPQIRASVISASGSSRSGLAPNAVRHLL